MTARFIGTLTRWAGSWKRAREALFPNSASRPRLRAKDLRESGDIGTYRGNLRRIATRFWKCYVSRKGYREGPYGFLIALCAALYPILSYLKARYEAE